MGILTWLYCTHLWHPIAQTHRGSLPYFWHVSFLATELLKVLVAIQFWSNDSGTWTIHTVCHVFGGFVERQESGIRNEEFATLSNVTCWSMVYSFILLQLAEVQFALIATVKNFSLNEATPKTFSPNFLPKINSGIEYFKCKK